MSVGQGNIKFTTITPQAGAPFAAGSAFNGVSVDVATGKIVLGDSVGSNLADLVSNREIEFNNFRLAFKDATTPGRIEFAPPEIKITSSNNKEISLSALAAPTLSLKTGVGAFPNQILFNNIGVSDNYIIDNTLTSGDFIIGNAFGAGNRTSIVLNDVGQLITLRTNAGRMLMLDQLNAIYQIGDIDLFGNGTNLSINDAANLFIIGNNANTAGIQINGVAGFSGTVTPVNSITVVSGIVTAVT